ncbi:uncharacterized protein LOC130629847 [Hydractinia symbiolongicarpus]|uniref:uncharacterized protein LOC130629847 n=1 Tax=Hydractinia symbiolongicarpus TaxID=13093 RepID=UPI00254A1325|nr:uncharacterized protein LOC130629847 [Hydractinia symbiolongicarpus]
MAQFTRPIQLPKIDLILSSDASLQGWGGTDGNSQIGGRWSEGELPEHINTLELLAAFFTLKAFLKIRHYRHVQLRLDNTTAVAYITKMGGLHSIACNKLAVEIWDFARTCDVWLSACHIPGVLNTIADYKSRQFQDNIEWSLNVKQFNIISDIFWKFDIDLFASRLNAKCEDYFSLRPDPDAKAVNAFAQTWSNLNFYAFPPFNLIGKVLAKINIDQATGILVVPFWSSQLWFPQAINMLYRTPVLFPPSSKLLFLPGTKRQHPLHQTLSLLMLPVSGNRYKVKSFHQTLSISLQHHGEKVPRNNTRVQSDDGYNIALGGGSGYSVLCTTRSAIASVVSISGYSSLSEHPLISRFIKGSLSPNKDLSFKDINIKLACLLTILAGQRVHSVHNISVPYIDLTDDVMLCHLPGLLKTTRPKKTDRTLMYRAFPSDPDLCPLQCTKAYLSKREQLISKEIAPLFVTFGKPHHAASKDTLSRWIKSAMTSAGIDTSVFSPGSCRLASGSKAKSTGVPLDVILKYGTWSRDSTFYRYYCRDVIGSVTSLHDLGASLLDSVMEATSHES